MAVLSALVLVEQGVAALAALRRHADTTVGGRRRIPYWDSGHGRHLVERPRRANRSRRCERRGRHRHPGRRPGRPPLAATAQVVGTARIPGCLAREVLAGTKGWRWWHVPVHPTRRRTVDRADPGCYFTAYSPR
ncbi:hypothetical protein HBB16_17285 [Pseudonocardia sp. MCCB 268]|nr:hypothetical protein [Pseudonocardia cytotoxica]